MWAGHLKEFFFFCKTFLIIIIFIFEYNNSIVFLILIFCLEILNVIELFLKTKKMAENVVKKE